MLAILGTMAILIVQSICSLAVIFYFHYQKAKPGNVVVTGVIPAIGAISMAYVVYLLGSHLAFAGGSASSSLFFTLIPWMVIVTFLLGLVFALFLKTQRPEIYQEIGTTVLEEAHERV